MGKIHLVTGGARSGKSEYAKRLGEKYIGPRTFIATCPIMDEEIRKRVARHRQERQGRQWKTIEEPLRLVEAINSSAGSMVTLVDCLTLWVNNILYESENQNKKLEEDDILMRSKEVITVCKSLAGEFIFVTNEIGMGLVPENEVSRRYRDLVGRCNQVMASYADKVTMIVSGLPLILKEVNLK